MTKQKKKRTVIAFERSTCSTFVVINENDFIDILKYYDDESTLDASFETVKLLKLLLKGTSLSQQQKDIISKKSAIRTFLCDSNIVASPFLNITLESLIYLYVSPDYSILRKSLDWIVDLVIKCGLSPKDKRQCIRGAFYRLQSKINLNNTDIDKIMSFTLAFNCIVMLDRETAWLDEEINIDTSNVKYLNDDSLLYQYVNTCAELFEYCARYIINLGSINDSADNNNDKQHTSIGAEIIRYAECSGECLRGVMMALKARLNTYIINLLIETSCANWSLLIARMMTSSCQLLSSQFLHKDIITQTAMFAIYLQWIYRYSNGNLLIKDKIRPGVQLIAILNILDDDNFDLNEYQISTTINLGVHEDILKYCRNFSPVSRFALIRGILSVFDDESLMFSVNHIDTPVLSSEIMDIVNMMNEKCKLHATKSNQNNFTCYCYEIIKKTCSSHVTSDRQIYGLQLLEAWLTRLYNIHLPYESLQDKFQYLSTLLIKAWSHPYKQLNHLAPNIYQN